MMPRWFSFGRSSNCARALLAKNTPLLALRYVVLDTELTSLDSRSNRLLSVGAITMQGAKIHLGEQFYRLVNPGVEVPAKSVLIHKLRPADVKMGEAPNQVLADLRRFIRDAVLVGHFIEIDIKALRKELAGSGHELDHPAVDTARVHRWLLRHKPHSVDLFQRMENIDLASLARLYKLEFREAHHALEDAFVTARLWQKLIYELDAMNVRTLGRLLRIGGI
jgi:DNA polymerase-3 subunit epsilon